MTVHIPSIVVVFFVILSVFAILLAFTYLLMLEWSLAQKKTPHYDDLTGVYTRGSIRRHICQHLSHINKMHQAQLTDCTSDAFILLDLDCFKQVNDTYGHPSGDNLLSGIADILLHSIRCSDIVGRMGGDEFIVFLTGIKNQEIAKKKANILLENIRSYVQDHPEWDGVSASLGISLIPDHGTTFEELYCKADAALYQAKNAGKDQICIYQDDFADSDEDLL